MYTLQQKMKRISNWFYETLEEANNKLNKHIKSGGESKPSGGQQGKNNNLWKRKM